MIGNGGPMTPPGGIAATGFATFADVTNSGNITVNVGTGAASGSGPSTLALTGGAGTNPITLGNGDVVATSCSDPAGFCGGSFAQIGNGGAGASPTTGSVHDTGDINVQVGTGTNSVGNITLKGADNTTETAN